MRSYEKLISDFFDQQHSDRAHKSAKEDKET